MNKKNIFSYASGILSVCVSIIFLVFTIIGMKDKIDNLFWIINGLIIFLVSCLFALGVFTKDDKYQNICHGTTSIFISLFILFNFLSLTNIIKVPKQDVLSNFVNKNISELITYGEKHNIKINQVFDYSDYVDEYYIISQDAEPNTLLKKVKEINVVVSSGANPNKTFMLQSLVGLNIDDALKIINENFMSNIEIDYEFSDDVTKDVVISQNINGEIKRNDLLKLVVSLGNENDLVPVEMINLKDKSLFEATLWLKRNGFKYEINYEFSDQVKRNYCLGQSEKEGTTVNPKETVITLIISKGKEIIAPDFTSMSVSEATIWVAEHKLKVVFKETYDNEIKQGNIISSNKPLNSKLEEGETIEITTSKGKLVMERFDNIESFRAWANSLNLRYEESSEFNDSASGTVIKITPNVGEAINLNETIYVTYSKGKSTTVPNFYNKSKNETVSLCNNNNLKCYYSYKYSSSVSKEYVVSQSIVAGSTVAEGTGITIYLSKGTEPKPIVQTCSSTETHTLRIQQNWVTGGTADSTISTLKAQFNEKYPLVTFNFVKKDGNLRSGFIHVDSPISNNSTVQDCKTYTIIINN